MLVNVVHTFTFGNRITLSNLKTVFVSSSENLFSAQGRHWDIPSLATNT
jgi:hypothetical protein